MSRLLLILTVFFLYRAYPALSYRLADQPTTIPKSKHHPKRWTKAADKKGGKKGDREELIQARHERPTPAPVVTAPPSNRPTAEPPTTGPPKTGAATPLDLPASGTPTAPGASLSPSPSPTSRESYPPPRPRPHRRAERRPRIVSERRFDGRIADERAERSPLGG